jgi:Protein of unknown function (DUF3605)
MNNYIDLHSMDDDTGQHPEQLQRQHQQICVNTDHQNETTSSIILPNVKYGYRTEPLRWGELVDIICVQKDFAKLTRSKEQQCSYEIFKSSILLQWRSITDYVLCTKFPNVFTRKSIIINDSDEEGNATITRCRQRYIADPPLEYLTNNTTNHQTYTALVKNDFPYYMESGTEHWILWKLGADCTISDIDIENAREQLCRHLRKGYIIHWINPPQLKSLPLIEHAHIIGKVTDESVHRDRTE